jgi:hypothetical protein
MSIEICPTCNGSGRIEGFVCEYCKRCFPSHYFRYVATEVGTEIAIQPICGHCAQKLNPPQFRCSRSYFKSDVVNTLPPEPPPTKSEVLGQTEGGKGL